MTRTFARYRDALTDAGFTHPLAKERRNEPVRSFDAIVTEWLDRHGIIFVAVGRL